MQSGTLPRLCGKHMGKITFSLQKSKNSLLNKTGCLMAAHDLQNCRTNIDIKSLAQFYTWVTAKPKRVPNTPNS